MRLSKRRAIQLGALAGGAFLGLASIAYPALALLLSGVALLWIGLECARSRVA